MPVGRRPCAGLGVGFNSVWVPNCGDATISRVETTRHTGIATIATGIADSEGSIGVGEGAVWMPTDANGILARIDPATNAIMSRIRVREASFAAAVGLGAVWVTSTTHNLVSRINPHTNTVVASIPVGPFPRFLAVGAGAVWVLNQGDGTVPRIDPLSNRVVATIEVGVPGPGGDIAVGERFVGVTAVGKPFSRIDPHSNRLVAQFVGEGGDALRIGHGSVWLASFFLQEIWRVDLTI